MKRSLTEIFVPKSCPLPADIAYIILEYANMCKFTDKSAVLDSGNLIIDTYSYTAKLNGKELNLRLREFNLLTFLMKNKGKA